MEWLQIWELAATILTLWMVMGILRQTSAQAARNYRRRGLGRWVWRLAAITLRSIAFLPYRIVMETVEEVRTIRGQ